MRGRTGIVLVVVAALFATFGVPAFTPTGGSGVDAAGPCTLTWALGGGLFFDTQFEAPTSWSENQVPGPTDTVCFPTGTVQFNVLEHTVGAISVAPGATLFLVAGTLNLMLTSDLAGVSLAQGAHIGVNEDVTISAGRSLSTTGGNFGTIINLGAATLTIDGTLSMSGGNGVMLQIDTINNGTIDVNTGSLLQLGAGRTLTNNQEVLFGPNDSVFGANDTSRFHNLGLIEIVGQAAGRSVMSGLTFDNDGVVRLVTSDTTLFVGGSSTGTWEIGALGSDPCGLANSSRLRLRAVGTYRFTDGTIGGPGCLGVDGQIAVSANVALTPGRIENRVLLDLFGDRTLPPITMFNTARLNISGGTAVAGGPIVQDQPTSAQFFGGDGRLEIPAGTPFGQVGGNIFDVLDSLDLVVAGPWYTEASVRVFGTATLTNLGVWNVGPNSGFETAAGANIRNEGTMLLDSGTGTIGLGGPRGIDNVGTFRLVNGTIDMRVPLVQLVGGQLTAGRIEMATGTHWIFFPAITSISGALRLEGTAFPGVSFDRSIHSLRGLSGIESAGVLELVDGAAVSVSQAPLGTLFNFGRLALASDAVLNVPTYTNDGTLAVEVGPTSGSVAVGEAFLGGRLEVAPAPGFIDPVAGRVVVDTTVALGGTFADVVAVDGGPVSVAYIGGQALLTYDPVDPTPDPPVIITTTASVFEGSGSGQEAHEILVSVQNPNTVVVPLTWSATGGTATLGAAGEPGVDATVPAGVFDLQPGLNLVPVAFATARDTLGEGDETFDIVWSPGAPATTVTILDDDIEPTVSITASNPYAEDAGEISLNLRLDRVVASPLTFRVYTVDGTAEAPEDYVAFDLEVTIPAGATEGPFVHVQLVNDQLAYEADNEFFAVVVARNGVDMAVTDVEILDDDDFAQARFVRQAADPQRGALVRSLVEGTTSNPTLPLQVELIGAPVTQPTTVNVTAQSFTAELGVDFTLSPTTLVFQPGDGVKTVTLTSIGDSEVELDDLVFVGMSTEFGDLLGRVDDVAEVTLLDDDALQPPDPAVGEFRTGWDALVSGTADWLGQFDLAPGDAPAVVTPRLADHFGLGDLVDELGLPSLDPADVTIDDLCADLQTNGFTVDFVAGGVCGSPVPTRVGDVIQARVRVTLADLAKAAGVTADPFNDATDGVLEALASSLDIDADGGWVGDLTVTIVVGVDENGFYVADDTDLALAVAGTLQVAGNATVAGGPASLSGTADTALAVHLAPSVPRQRDLLAPLEPSLDGNASMSLDFETGPLTLGWTGAWTMDGAGVATGLQQVDGSLVLPGVTQAGAGASLDVTGLLSAGQWHLTAQGDAAAAYLLGGFDAGSLEFAADIGPDTLVGSGTIVVTAPVPGGDRAVAVTVAFDASQLTISGSVLIPGLAVGSPVLLQLTDAFVIAEFGAALPGGPLIGGVEVGAATASVLPADPVGSATGLIGGLGSDGGLTLEAATAQLQIADGAILVDLAVASFGVGPGSGAELLSVGSATGTFPALDDLTVEFTDLVLAKDGTFGASAVNVASQGLARSIGLGGVLPFDVLEVTVVFPDPGDLTNFDVSVVGRFDFSAFPEIAGFTPRIAFGGQVVTPSTPDDQNRFTFAVAVDDLANGVVRPLDVGPLTLGFDGLPAGDYTLGGEVTLGGFANGVFVPSLGGGITVDGPAGSLVSGAEVVVAGTLTSGDPTVVDVEGTVTVSGDLTAGVTVEDLALTAGVRLAFGSAGLSIEPRLVGLDVGAITFPFGDFMTLRAEDVQLFFDPGPGDPFLVIGDGGLTVEFGDEFPMLAAWGGTARNISIGRDLVPRLLPGFGMDLLIPDPDQLGLPEFLPLQIDSVGITFPDVLTDPPTDGLALTPELLTGMRIRVSGGLVADENWPISAAVDGLEIDLGKLTTGQFPITNLSGISFGVEPFEMPGGVVIGGGLKLRTIDVDGETVFYGRIFGDFAVADIGGGADLVVTQYGPVLMKVRAPLGIPLGPSGVVLAGVEGAAQFGPVGIKVPPVGDPIALLNNFTLPTDLTITEDVIRDAVRPAVNDEEYTWEQGFALSMAGDLIVAAAPGILKGRATIGMNLGLPEGPDDPPGLQLVGKGEVTAFGIPLGLAGMLIDFTEPIEPSFDLAFASPVPGSPLAVVFPAQATFGVQLRTDGVVLGTIAGLRIFLEQVLAGSLDVAQELFEVVLDEVAVRLDDSRSRPLARLLLDVDGDGTISVAESGRVITSQFLVDRLLGRNGLPPLLPSSVDPAAFDDAARAATALMNELLLLAGEILDNPTVFGTFVLDGAGSGSGFEGLSGPGGAALAALADVIREATADALVAFGARFNPSFAIKGALQPTFLGLPLGSPVVGGELFIDRNGLFFEMEGSMTEIGQSALGLSFPLAAPLIDAAMTVATAGITDEIQIGARLPFGGIVDALIGGTELPTFQPLDPNWAVTVSGSMSVLGFEAAELSGIAFLPGQATFLDSRIQKLYEQPPGTPIDENRIPITTQAHFDALVDYGGILVTASLRVPRLVTDPTAQLATFPPPPDDPLQYLAWLDDIAVAATQTDTPARVQFFVPGIANVFDDQQAVDWASSFYLEGVWDGRVLGLDLGRGLLNLTPAGLELAGQFPLAGVEGTVTLNTALLSSGKKLPSAGLDISLDTASIAQTLAAIGVPSVLVPPVNATGRLRAFTPGFDPNSTDRVRRNGGIEVTAQLGTPGLIGNAEFSFAVSPRKGGVDIIGRAVAQQIGPIAGVTITNADITVEVIKGVAKVRVQGAADVLGAQATVDGVLNGDLTGSLTFSLDSGTMNLAGLQINGSVVLTTTRKQGQLTGSLGLVGTATLPQWLAAASGAATVAAAACVDTAGNMQAVLAMPALNVGPGGLVRIGRNNAQAALPPGPAACAIPAGGPQQPSTGPLVAWRVANGVPSLVIDGNLTFTAANAAIAGLTVTGNLNGTAGTGSLAVAFSAGNMNLGGFSIAGSASLVLGVGLGGGPTLSMNVNGSLSVPGLLNNASVSGSGNQNGISSLAIAVTGFTLPVVNIDSATLNLTRLAGTSTYRISAGLQVDVPGVANNLAVSGTLDTAGNGSLAMSVSTLSIRSASITDGTFALVKTGSTVSLRAAGRFTLFGVALEVVQADLTLGSTTINGNLVIRPVGGGTLSLGGWTIGGTLRLAFSGASLTIEIDNGTVAIPGWGTVNMDGSLSVPPTNGASFTLSLPANGLRLGGASSPFFAVGTFTLSFANNVGTLSVVNGGLAWRDGNTTVASVGVPLLSISTSGAVSASLTGFSAIAGSFSLTVPSVSFAVDPQGLNARLTMGAGSVAIPGLPTLTTPAFTISTGNFAVTLASSNIDLGIVRLIGDVVLRRSGGVFSLSVEGERNAIGTITDPAVFAFEGLVDIDMNDLSISSDGAFSIDVAAPRIGGDIGIVNARLVVTRTTGPDGAFSGALNGGQLLIGTAPPIPMLSLTFDTATRIDRTFSIGERELGPFFRMSSASLRVRHLANGVIRAELVDPVSVAVFDGSGTLTLNDLEIETDGTFEGSVTGRLALFGFRISTATFDVRRQNGVIELRLPAGDDETLDLGFLTMDISGEARSDGTFSFTGSSSVGPIGFPGFNLSGSVQVTVSTSGISGSYSGSVCIGSCAHTSGTLRSDGRISGELQIDHNGDGDYNDWLEVNAKWYVYLKSPVSLRVDINRDGDFEDFGDLAFGPGSSADGTQPGMSQPPNISVSANIGAGGSVRVYYVVPTAWESNVDLPVRCTPAPGSLFSVGSTTVTCRATDENGNVRARTFTVTVQSSASASTPTATGGATVLVEASGFQPNSWAVATMFSSPIVIGIFQVDGNGRLVLPITVPDGLPPGMHDIVIEGFAPDGSVMQFVQPVFVPGPGVELPRTGADTGSGPLLPLAVGFLLIGIVLLAAGRRPLRSGNGPIDGRRTRRLS